MIHCIPPSMSAHTTTVPTCIERVERRPGCIADGEHVVGRDRHGSKVTS